MKYRFWFNRFDNMGNSEWIVEFHANKWDLKVGYIIFVTSYPGRSNHFMSRTKKSFN